VLRRKTRAASDQADEENPFLLSISDLMAGLLAVFILTLISAMIQLNKQKDNFIKTERELKERIEEQKRLEAILRQRDETTREENRRFLEQLERSMARIRQAQTSITLSISRINQQAQGVSSVLGDIQEELARRGVRVVVADKGTVLRIPEQDLQFDSGSYTIRPSAEHTARELGRALLDRLRDPAFREDLDKVFIEGHTDSQPYSREMGNWGLSTFRAISLWKYWTEGPANLGELATLRSGTTTGTYTSKPLFSVSGYADTYPTVEPEPGVELPANRPADRRIDLRFTLRFREQENLDSVRDGLTNLESATSEVIEMIRQRNAQPAATDVPGSVP
jgi:flagellar motor protein MotB